MWIAAKLAAKGVRDSSTNTEAEVCSWCKGPLNGPALHTGLPSGQPTDSNTNSMYDYEAVYTHENVVLC